MEIRLIYASTVPDGLDPSEIEDILQTARDHNTRQNITGILCFTTEYFVQCLEGDRERVNDLYAAIVRDPRHRRPVVLHYEEVSSREFREWSMAYVEPSEETDKILKKHTGGIHFNPYLLNAATALAMLVLLRDRVPDRDRLA
jgi:hypothetical protein